MVKLQSIESYPTYDVRVMEASVGRVTKKVSFTRLTASFPSTLRAGHSTSLQGVAFKRWRPLSTHFSSICKVTAATPVQRANFSALQVRICVTVCLGAENICYSAGIGRTGVIILCDIMLRMTATEGAVDFYGCVERMRKERPNIVPNFDLYKLAHLVVLAARTGNFCLFSVTQHTIN